MVDNERIVSSGNWDDALVAAFGGCPLCGVAVLWAFSGRESPERVLLEIASGAVVSVPAGRTVVVASGSGFLSVVTSRVYSLHVCDPNLVTNAVGDYTAVVLSHSCPVDSCFAPPGEMCVSPRYDVLPRPHGSRVALASGSPWGDEELISPVNVDE